MMPWNSLFRRRMGWLALLILLATAVAPASVRAETNQPDRFTLADLGQSDIAVRTVYDQVKVHFPLAAGRKIDQATLQLYLSHGKSLLPELSDLTIALNDEPVASLPLTADNAEKAFIPIALPVGALRPGDNVFTFRFRLRLRHKGCSDEGDAKLWARIDSDTIIELSGRDAPLAPDLSRYPFPFDTLSTLPGSPQATIVLPPQPTAAEMTAAAQIAASLGQAANWESPSLRMTTFDALTETMRADHLIAIDTNGRNPLAQGQPEGITMLTSPSNPHRLLLVVSGADDAGLLQAAALLATRSARAELPQGHADLAPIVAEPLPKRPSRATFAELGYDARRVRGIRQHDLYYAIDIPYEWKITSDAAIELRFSHARGLDADTSLFSAFINGSKVTDVSLTRRNATDGRLVIQLSPRQLHPGRNWLHLSFDLNLRRQNCSTRYLEEAWAEVSAADSILNLAHVNSAPPLELRFLPSPLVTPADLSAALFVLPAAPTPDELTALAQTAAKLGTYTAADGLRPQAMLADQFDESVAANSHVIAIGAPQSHALLAAYNDQLPQNLIRMSTKGAQQTAHEFLDPLSEDVEERSGYLQLLAAPWASDKAFIVLSPSDEVPLERVTAVLPVKGKRLKLQGNVAVVAPDNSMTGLALGSLAGATLPSSVSRFLSLALIGVFVVVGGVGWASGRRKRMQEQELNDEDE